MGGDDQIGGVTDADAAERTAALGGIHEREGAPVGVSEQGWGKRG
jgi:hypothetical protein